MSQSIFRSAITDGNGDVDAGYLAMFALMALVVGAIPIMVIGAFLAMWFDPTHEFNVKDLGIGIGAVCGGFATAAGGIGMFRAGDKPRTTKEDAV